VIEAGDDDAEMSFADRNTRKTARDLMWENGGPGVWAPDYREIYDLKDDDWRFDTIPEIIDGKNIADFVDADILKKLEELELEEDQLIAELESGKMGEDEDSELDEEEQAAVDAIRERKKTIKVMRLANKTQNKPMVPRAIRGRAKDKHDPGAFDAKEIKKKMDQLGVDSSKMLERGRSMAEARGRKRERSLSRRHVESTKGGDDDVDMADISGMSKGQQKKVKKEKRSLSLARSHSRPREPSAMGLKDDAQVKVAEQLEKQGRKGWSGAAGEGDHTKSVHLVKWMNTGKKRMGTHYCR
jgi:nucleolar GTP-binding protein